MQTSATLGRFFLSAALSMAAAGFGYPAPALAQAEQFRPDTLQPAVPFPEGNEEPAVERPTVASPTVEEPSTEEPLIEERLVEESSVEESTVEEPSVEARPSEPATVPPAASERPTFPLPMGTQRSPLPFGGSTSIFENLTLAPSVDPSPKTIRGISGGPLPASDVAGRPETATGPCLGFVDTQPDHILTLTDAFDYLSLQVQSAEDTTLVVKGPGGSWCNDNYLSLNPGIAGQWLPGRYEIWIGSQRNNGYFPYVIRVLQSPEVTP